MDIRSRHRYIRGSNFCCQAEAMMNKRMRSPNYPSMPLKEALDVVGKMFSALRTSIVGREDAARAMGFTGLTGRSGKVLSNLIQYGLLQKAGKNEVRVSQRAVEILHPDSDESRARAIMDAAFAPELFQELRERFDEGVLHEGSIRSYLLKRGFTDAALQPAIRAYVETHELAQQFAEYDGHGHTGHEDGESVSDQEVMERPPMRRDQFPSVSRTGEKATEPSVPSSVTPIGLTKDGRIVVSCVIGDQAEAEQIKAAITALEAFLPKSQPPKDEAKGGEATTPHEAKEGGEGTD